MEFFRNGGWRHLASSLFRRNNYVRTYLTAVVQWPMPKSTYGHVIHVPNARVFRTLWNCHRVVLLYLMRFCCYNPLVAKSTLRLWEIEKFIRCAVIVLVGTQRKHLAIAESEHMVQTCGSSTAVHFGWDVQPSSNNTAGVSFLISKKLASKNSFSRIFPPPTAARRRAGAIRTARFDLDICLIGFPSSLFY